MYDISKLLIGLIGVLKLFYIILSFLLVFIFFIFFFKNTKINMTNLNFLIDFRYFLTKVIIFLSLCFFNILLVFTYSWNDGMLNIDNFNVLGFTQKYKTIEFNFFIFNQIFSFQIDKFSVAIGLLFSILFPLITILFNFDYKENYLNFYLYLTLIFIFSYFIIFTNNLLLFYISYEFILILVFAIMYLSSNSRGGIEATLFFAGWAILGSILVGLGVIITIVLTGEVYFNLIAFNKLNATETFYIYFLFFFGFGTKLSTWPFWYWLPRAHVEVSTSMSIYLSCILIKLSYFCLIRLQLLLKTEISLNIFILATLFCTLDIVYRIMSQKDLKALIAYSSVLHTNLLLTLIHLDMSKAMKLSMLYVWGHSLSTACLFICVNLIELKYNSRNILYVSGLWNFSPSLGVATLWSLLSFLDFPCTMFFWGEFWLWTVLLANFPLLAIYITFLCVVIFGCIFFKIWWCVLFGAPDSNVNFSDETDSYDLWIILWALIILQLVSGLQPSIVSSLVSFLK